jgi:hypothetical protein
MPVLSYTHDFLSTGNRRSWVSLDRIIPEKGYVAGNMDFICYRCNLLKNDATIAEFETPTRLYETTHLAAVLDTAIVMQDDEIAINLDSVYESR